MSARRGPVPQERVRLNSYITPDNDAYLSRMQEQLRINRSDAVNRALAIAELVERETEREHLAGREGGEGKEGKEDKERRSNFGFIWQSKRM